MCPLTRSEFIAPSLKAKNSKIYNVMDPKLQDFEKALHKLCLNLAKQIVVDGEGACLRPVFADGLDPKKGIAVLAICRNVHFQDSARRLRRFRRQDSGGNSGNGDD